MARAHGHAADFLGFDNVNGDDFGELRPLASPVQADDKSDCKARLTVSAWQGVVLPSPSPHSLDLDKPMNLRQTLHTFLLHPSNQHS